MIRQRSASPNDLYRARRLDGIHTQVKVCPSAARRVLLGAALCTTPGLLGGCRPDPAGTRHATPPQAVSKHEPAVRLIEAMNGPQARGLVAWMSSRLRSRVGVDGIERASHRLRDFFGPALGVLAERVHREGPLQWYSGLVVHGRPRAAGGDGILRPVLYQFAEDGQRKLTRLLVREHWFVQDIQHPARDYLPVTRFHFVSTGEWNTLHGGRTRATNYHHGSRTQRWAYDLVVRKSGRQHPVGAKRNQDYYCYGRPVLAPAPGVVVERVDGVPENRPGKRGRAGGNGVVIDHGFGEYSSLWHGIPGTVRVKKGDTVELGQELFRVGNSGSSTGPHIHFHVTARDRSHPMGLPAAFSDVYINGKWRAKSMPARGDSVLRVETPRIAAGPEVLLDT